MSFCSHGLAISRSNFSANNLSNGNVSFLQYSHCITGEFRVFDSRRNPIKLVAFRQYSIENRFFVSQCVGSGSVSKTVVEESGVSEPRIDGGNGGSGSGGDGDFGSGSGGRGGGDGDGEGDEEFGPIMKFEEVMKEVEARGVSLPLDMVEAAKTTGIRQSFLFRYLDLQGSAWPLAFLMKHCSMLRNRMLADPSFLFKVGTEVVIDSCCATFAEVQKRGKDFWAEFELYAADLLVGVVVDIALVGMLAPYARIGRASVSKGLFGRLQQASRALPSSVFEVERPGCKFTAKQRVATYFYKGVLYGSVGFGCGLIGQGIANMIMNAKRSIRKSEEDMPVPLRSKSAALLGVFLGVSSNTPDQIIRKLGEDIPVPPLLKSTALGGVFLGVSSNTCYQIIRKSEEDIPVPPLFKSAALWGVFLGVSSNTRYQIINGLEQLVERSALAKQVPPVAMAFTVGVRFANNIYGGMQFVDWAKWSGVQ